MNQTELLQSPSFTHETSLSYFTFTVTVGKRLNTSPLPSNTHLQLGFAPINALLSAPEPRSTTISLLRSLALVYSPSPLQLGLD